MRRVLIGDDNSTSLAMEKSFLEVRDFKIFTMTSAGNIMDLAREIQPDLIILDFEMQDMDVEKACRRLKRHGSTQRIPVLVTTAQDPDRIKRQCLEAGATAIVSRPENREALLRNIIQTLGLPQRAHVRTACDFHVGIDDAGERTEGVAQNISQSGLYLTVRKILQGGAALRLSFMLPRAAAEIQVLGEVVRIETLVGGLYGYGIQFLEADPDSLQALKAFAQRQSERNS